MALACHRGTKTGDSTHEPRAHRALPAVICAAVYTFKHSPSLLPSLLKVANPFIGGYSDSGMCLVFGGGGGWFEGILLLGFLGWFGGFGMYKRDNVEQVPVSKPS